MSDELQELFQMNLVALFAGCLDEIEGEGTYVDSAWKKKPIRLCCEEHGNTLAFLEPWLVNDIKLGIEPLLKWFHMRDDESIETRRRANGVRELVQIVVKSGTYDARVRSGLKLLARYLNISWGSDISPFENFLAKELLSANLNGSTSKRSSSWSLSRVAKVSAAAAMGGTAIALTAGAAAPVIAPLFGALFATQFSVSVALSIALFGSAGAGLTGYKMADRTERALKEFFFEKVERDSSSDSASPSTSLSLVIGVPGSMDSGDVVLLKKFWANAFSYETSSSAEHGWSDVFVLVFDRDVILEYSKTVGDLLKDKVVSHAYSYFLKQILGQAFMAAVSLPLTVANAFDVINNSFVRCESRAKGAGIELASALRLGCHGARPVTLVGFGFGALAIFHALEVLAGEQAFGIVEDVVLIGTPLRANVDRWKAARAVASGKFVNGYCKEDWTLKLVMQWSTSSSAVAGVDPVTIPRITNLPLSINHYQLGRDGGQELNHILKSILDE